MRQVIIISKKRLVSDLKHMLQQYFWHRPANFISYISILDFISICHGYLVHVLV